MFATPKFNVLLSLYETLYFQATSSTKEGDDGSKANGIDFENEV